MALALIRPVIPCRPDKGPLPSGNQLLLNQITNCRPILLNIEHGIAMVARVQRNVIDGLRTVADHFQNFPFLQLRHRFQRRDGRVRAGLADHIKAIIRNNVFHADSLAGVSPARRKKCFSQPMINIKAANSSR